MKLSEPGVARDAAREIEAHINWVIAIGVGIGITLLVLTHLGARAFLSWYRERRTPEFPLAT